jgi:malate dehydrogenase (oxaloacetate-decarboxylating)
MHVQRCSSVRLAKPTHSPNPSCAMAQHTRRPIIFPLSNPTERSEATPQDLLAWTEDRAIVGTGSPFPPIIWAGRPFRIDQVNNAYAFSGCRFGHDRC